MTVRELHGELGKMIEEGLGDLPVHTYGDGPLHKIHPFDVVVTQDKVIL